MASVSISTQQVLGNEVPVLSATSTASLPDLTAFDTAVSDARMARDFRRWKREALRSPSGHHPHTGLTPGHYEVRARRCEHRVREAALKAEISLARDLRHGQVAA